MGIIELFMAAVALSMDAFAVAMCKGLAMKHIRWRQVGLIALFFGGFQALMPLLGWLVGRRWEQSIVAYDHWVAFVLLGFIGGKMIWEALHHSETDDKASDIIRIGELFVLAVATSIDALAVGITFAFLQVQILPSVMLIGVTTFALSAVGVVAGHQFGTHMMKKAEIGGGVVLVLIGLKILLEHLGVI